ncbi:hypothetical protein SLE2022_128930 [Rubroshorea leprosula]
MVEDDANISSPRGGPIYIPNLVSTLTSVPKFQKSLLQQLQDLKVELNGDTSELTDADDIFVDDLRILSEEQLVEIALKEAFKDGDNSLKVSEKCSNACSSLSVWDHNWNLVKWLYIVICQLVLFQYLMSPNYALFVDINYTMNGGCSRSRNKQACLGSTCIGDDNSASGDFANGCSSVNSSNQTALTKKNSSRKRIRKVHDHHIENSYVAKVEEVIKIKQKQDEAKAAARLHCLSAGCQSNDCSVPSSENIERMQSLRSTTSARKVSSSDIEQLIPVSGQEVVLCVEVYHNVRKWAKIQEFLVLGQQKLTELRDKIYCLSDQVMQKARQHDPSGYFLIEGVFYNDLRDPSAIDYSKSILDWLSNSKDDALRKWECSVTGQLQQKHREILGSAPTSELPHFEAVNMHEKQFCNLNFRLGAGYLYCHQGDCKHTIVIRDMRLIHPEDVKNQAAYPIVIFQLKPRVQKCNACKIYRATKVTTDNKWAHENPCYFCDHCYTLLHSGADPSSYTDFSVYNYVHD